MTTISLKDAGVYFGPGGQLQQDMRKAAQKGLLSAALRAVREIVTKEIPAAVPPPVDRGVYKAGWRAEKIPEGAVLYNATPWAQAIEDGIPAGRVILSTKMQIALAEWVKRKLGGGRQPGTGRPKKKGPTPSPTPPLQLAKTARHRRDYGPAWDTAARIMHAMKKHGIFKRGQGLKILSKFSTDKLPQIVKEEVERELEKALK